MGQLIRLAWPLVHIMMLAVALGVLGYLCAIFLTILAGQVILKGLSADMTLFHGLSVTGILVIMGVIAVLRGALHYIEQYCNHYIAFI